MQCDPSKACECKSVPRRQRNTTRLLQFAILVCKTATHVFRVHLRTHFGIRDRVYWRSPRSSDVSRSVCFMAGKQQSHILYKCSKSQTRGDSSWMFMAYLSQIFSKCLLKLTCQWLGVQEINDNKCHRHTHGCGKKSS